jgi:hypothetical protein
LLASNFNTKARKLVVSIVRQITKYEQQNIIINNNKNTSPQKKEEKRKRNPN